MPSQDGGLLYLPAAQKQGENSIALLKHMAVNMPDIRWELDYMDIYALETVCRQKAERYEK